MKWILERNLYSEENFSLLVNALDRFGTDYSIVKRIPFFNILVDEDNQEVKLNICPDEKVFVCGSTGMGEVAKANGWFPGYFDGNLDYELMLKRYRNNALNYRAVITTLRKGFQATTEDESDKMLDIIGGNRFFSRPVSDKKSFAGAVFDHEEFDDWRAKVLKMEVDNTAEENSMTTLKPDDKIVLAPLTNIYQEYRFFVVDRKIITGSMYKLGSKVLYSDVVPERITEYAQVMANQWSPNRAYCLDIAVTDVDERLAHTNHGDLKVIEINALNSAGFYRCDMNKFVAAINAMEFDNCEHCHGMQGGIPGNENIIDGKRTCDYCHAKMMG